MTISPLGHRNVVAMRDEWGRTLARERYSSDDPINAKERLELTLDPDTGAVLEERQLTPDGSGGWVVTGASVRVNDSLGRLYQTISPDDGGIGEYTYDPGGNTISYKDQNHSEPNVLYEYDNLGRMISVKQLSTPPDDNPYIETSYGYDSSGNLTSVTDANGNTTHYDVDDFGQTYLIDSPVTGATTMGYNMAGQQVSKVNALNVNETRTYSPGGRLVETTWGDADDTQKVTYGYDRGRRIWAETRRGVGDNLEESESWSYDRRGLILSYERGMSDSPLGSKVISYIYDEDGARPIEISVNATPVASGIKYLAYGPAYHMTRGAATESFGYDLSYRTTSQQVRIGLDPPLIDRSYSYDSAGNLAGIIDNVSPDRGKTFGYDDLGRLRSQTRQQPFSVLSYDYDSIGNRILMSEFKAGSQATSVSTTEYSYQDVDSALLLQARQLVNGALQNELNISHDDAGNVTNDGQAIYTYDVRNKLAAVSDTGEQLQMSFRYDSAGLRFLSSAEAGQRMGWSVETYLQPGGKPFFEVTLDEADAVVEEKLYIHFGNRLLSIISGGFADHVISDHIGYPIAAIDAQGSVPWHADHDPFGEVGEHYAGSNDPLMRYPGQWQPDPAVFIAPSNLFYNGNRWYNPSWGRYTQSDPLGLYGGDNMFIYVENNPFSGIDPRGLFTIPGSVPKCLMEYAKKELPKLVSNKIIVNNLVNITGCSTTEVEKGLRWGTDPKIRLDDMTAPHLKQNNPDGYFNPATPDTVFIRKPPVELVCKAKCDNALIDMGGVILHEYAHYLYYKCTGVESTCYAGTAFDKKTYPNFDRGLYFRIGCGFSDSVTVTQ
jgi:RHS repeat-associated protein